MEVNLKDQWAKDNLGPFAIDQEKKTPFKVYIYKDLLNEESVPKLRDAINSCVKLKIKNNDLYNFKQSKDLKSQVASKQLQPIIHDFIDVMINKVRPHLENVTGKKLNEKSIDITASRYDVGNYLLCHNDDIKDNVKQQGRTLAFVYYLNSKTWTPKDGGSLILFDSDATGEPVTENNRISPKPNTLIVFETTPTSWHSVEEVYCKDDHRLSINGWFHSKHIDRKSIDEDDKSIIEPCPYEFMKPLTLDERLERFFKDTFNQDYLMERTCLTVRKRFKRKSEINLVNFLKKDKYIEINNALKEVVKNEDNLTRIGPYNKRNYKTIKLDKIPQVCRDLFDAFRSDLFFMLLSRLTGLDLVPPSVNEDEDNNTQQEAADVSSDSDDDEDDSDSYSDLEDEESDENDDSDNEVKILNIADQLTKADEKPAPPPPPTSTTTSNPTTTTVTSQPGTADGESPSKKLKLNDSAIIKENLEVIKKKSKRKFDTDPLARLQYRYLERGSYTLIHDYGYELGEKSALDVILHFNHDFAVNFDDGGYISYIDASPEDDLHDMDCELLTVEPKSNCLSLVYRSDSGTCRFLKHISDSHKSNYFDLYGVYYERPGDLPRAEDAKLNLVKTESGDKKD